MCQRSSGQDGAGPVVAMRIAWAIGTFATAWNGVSLAAYLAICDDVEDCPHKADEHNDSCDKCFDAVCKHGGWLAGSTVAKHEIHHTPFKVVGTAPEHDGTVEAYHEGERSTRNGSIPANDCIRWYCCDGHNHPHQ